MINYFVVFYLLIGLLFFIRFLVMFLDEPGTKTDFFVYGIANFMAWPLFFIGILLSKLGVE